MSAINEHEDGEKGGYIHWGKPYTLIGEIPQSHIEQIKELFGDLCAKYGRTNPEPRKLGDGAMSYHIALWMLREGTNYLKSPDSAQAVMDDIGKIREISKQSKFEELEELLLEKEPEDNFFIISPEGDLYAILW